eukprot:358796-Chlamydomonas_euryale.AAC.14
MTVGRQHAKLQCAPLAADVYMLCLHAIHMQPVDEDVCRQTVHAAFEAGINLFDTSPYYGITKAETVSHRDMMCTMMNAACIMSYAQPTPVDIMACFRAHIHDVPMLGKAIQGLPRSELVIATKVGRYGADEFNFSADRVTASVTESLNRLQTNYIDIIQCHDIEFGDLEVVRCTIESCKLLRVIFMRLPDAPDAWSFSISHCIVDVVNETLPALQKLKAQGLVRHIGITGLPFKVFHYVLDRVSAGTVDVVLSYCHNTLNDSTLLLELPYFESKGVGVINASPLAMGLLTNSGPPDWHPAPQRLLDAARDAAQRASARGADLPKLAVCEAVKTPGIASTLVGMLSPDVVATNVESALQVLYDPCHDTLDRLPLCGCVRLCMVGWDVAPQRWAGNCRLLTAHTMKHTVYLLACTLAGATCLHPELSCVSSQALGVIPNPSAGLESDALSDVRDALSDVQGLTWPSGRVENN